MSYQVRVSSRAESDIAEILQFYDAQDPGLGPYFLLCLDATFEQLKRTASSARIVRHEYRRTFVRKFPVCVFFILKEDQIIIDIVEPMRRDPDRLRQKLS